jgi:hypothetical protein
MSGLLYLRRVEVLHMKRGMSAEEKRTWISFVIPRTSTTLAAN